MRITGIGRALPEQTITNDQLAGILDTSDAWIRSRTGIGERRILPAQDLRGLAAQAAGEALRDADLPPEALDYILVATTLGDYLFPSLACLVQRDIGAACPAMDLHAACTGFLYALDAADALLQSGKARHILIVGAEAVSRLANWEDRATAVLFGDGAGAVVVDGGEGLLSLHLTARGDLAVLRQQAPPGNCPYTQGPEAPTLGLQMQGQEVFRFAVSQSPRDLEAALQQADVPLGQVDWFLLHQANRRILDAVASRLKLDPRKLPSNIHRLGNTSAASIPLLLWELYHAGHLQPGQILALSAFGAGLTSGACVLRWTKPVPAHLIPADDLFPIPID
ncbi:MAG: beta-ketoacyl-ACP synthase III [Christensenellales bacterium]